MYELDFVVWDSFYLKKMGFLFNSLWASVVQVLPCIRVTEADPVGRDWDAASMQVAEDVLDIYTVEQPNSKAISFKND